MNHHVVIVYIPVLHQGYIDFLKRNAGAERIYIVDKRSFERFSKSAKKDIRAVSVSVMRNLVISLDFREHRVWELNQHSFNERARGSMCQFIKDHNTLFVVANDELTRRIAECYLPMDRVTFDTAFLRWDRDTSEEHKEIRADRITSELDHVELINAAQDIGGRGSDFWRRVGAVLVKGGEPILAGFGHHVPTEHMPYMDGDPRANYSRGVRMDLSTALHAEQHIAVQALKDGISLRGTSLYITTFPCPSCAKLIAYSGITKLYYSSGYAVLDGERILKDQGVEIIFVKI